MEQSQYYICVLSIVLLVSRIKKLVGKIFILSGKVRENEFCNVVGTLDDCLQES